MAQAVDPLRLLQQLEQLQKALWHHAVKPGSALESSKPDATMAFSVQQCAELGVPAEGITAPRPALLKQARRRKYQKSGRPHDWRTRADPFEGCWEQITAWLTAHPERTGVSLFQELSQLYPGRWRPTQCRTLQRGVRTIRRRLLVTFEEQWQEQELGGALPAPILRAEIVAVPS